MSDVGTLCNVGFREASNEERGQDNEYGSQPVQEGQAVSLLRLPFPLDPLVSSFLSLFVGLLFCDQLFQLYLLLFAELHKCGYLSW